MDRDDILHLLERVQRGAMSPAQAADALRALPFERLGDTAVIDHHRSLRAGVPEVVLGEHKRADDIAQILEVLAARGAGALATRVDADKAAIVCARLPGARYDELARAIVIAPARPGSPLRNREEPQMQGGARTAAEFTGVNEQRKRSDNAADGASSISRRADRPSGGAVVVVAAGTSDLPVAQEACLALEFLGCAVDRIVDVGVAGLHRVLAHLDRIRAADAVIVIAGMEGALPSVVAGLIDRPVIAVPTSVGYGVSAGGFAALLGMLSSCSPGVMVVNIDNGFGAAVGAALIARRRSEPAGRARRGHGIHGVDDDA